MRRTFRQVIHDASVLLWEDIKDAKWAVIFIIAYFVFGKNYLYSLCPMVIATGFPCPGCGLTRAGICLLKLDFAGAFRIHPFIYGVVFYIGIFSWNRYVRKSRMGTRLKALMIIMLACVIIFYIWRMVNYFPGDPPMGYYKRNLLWSILHG